MLGTIISSATFLALPAAAYVLDWRQLAVNLVLPIVDIVAVVVFIPFFRRGKLTSAFEYFGHRYGQVPRLYGTVSFVALQLIRMAQILFLVSLPIQFLTGAPIGLVIIAAGLYIAFHTIAGGIEAVVWTDVVKAVILLLGGVLCFACVAIDLPGGLEQIIEVGRAEDKFSLGSFQWDLGQRTFWTVAILGVINWLAIYSGDQNIVQRYAAARSTREARKPTIIYYAVALPMWAMFFFVGTALFVYYQTFPDTAVATLEADQVLPYFVLNRIPTGIAGLAIAAVMAAAMSSLDSGVNSVSTVVVVDLLTEHDITHVAGAPEPSPPHDTIATGEFPIDSFPVRKRQHTDTVVLQGYLGMLDAITRPYAIPYRVMIPETLDRLIVPVAVSATHVAFSSVRMEPTWMALGQAAGVAAHLAIARGTPLRAVPIEPVQRMLRQPGQVLDQR